MSSTVTAHPSNPTTPAFSDELEWITAYLTVHSLSVPSRRYSFWLWIVVVLVFLTFAILHWTGSRAGVLGAYWSKWSLRRRTWRKKHSLAIARKKNQPHRQPPSLPSNAQLLSLTALLLVCLTLAFVGPDYISPNLKVWQLQTRRSTLQSTAHRPQQLYDTSTFEPYVAQYTISKSLWSSSARTGQIAFALFPLCVLFALKAPPFAIFAVPFMIQIFFDKLAWLHRWSGRLIWFLTTIHVVLWSIQLGRDRNPSTGRLAYLDAWSYQPFIYGWIAFGLLTLTIILSIHPIRRNFYESFYFLHVLLVPLTLITAALHHPPIWWWCWAALAGWVGERLWRGTWWIYSNGFAGGMSQKTPPPVSSHSKGPSGDLWEMDSIRYLSPETRSLQLPHDTHSIRSPSPLSPYYVNDKGPISSRATSPLSATRPSSTTFFPPKSDIPRPVTPHTSPLSYIPPTGYAHAELLSGRTIRLRLITPGFLPWSPGQHFLLNIPSVSRFTSHPFTCASVCDEEAPTDEGRIMVFLVRAKKGWTQDLWDLVARMTAERSLGDVPNFGVEGLPKRGVLLRTYVDGPFGSAKRARWGNYSTAVIITGGSGVSFGLSILQYLTFCMAGRDGKRLGGTPGGWGKKLALTKRVRFIWLVREYSHVQWCASIIRRCLAMVSSSALQVDIYVTNFKPIPSQPVPPPQIPPRTRFALPDPLSDEQLEPPHPGFARETLTHHRTESSESMESHQSYESDVDLSYYTGDYDEEPHAPDDLSFVHETNILELTNFEGDDDTALPGELHLSRSVKKEGKLRRLQSRRASTGGEVKKDTDTWTDFPLAFSPAPPLAPARSRRVQRLSALSAASTDRLLPVSPLSDRRKSALSSDTELVSPVRTRPPHAEVPSRTRGPSEVMTAVGRPTIKLVTPPPPIALGGPSASSPLSALSWDGKSETGSSHGLLSSLPQMTTDMLSDQVRFEMDEQEAMDLNIVAEHARPGKPKLDKVIADEVEVAKQGVIVACCGPTSLNAMVRKIIAAQIDPGRIRRGDMRGSIALVSEEFEY